MPKKSAPKDMPMKTHMMPGQHKRMAGASHPKGKYK